MKNADSNSIVLIGMPSAGKSTLGILLAKQLAKGFVDTDLMLQESIDCHLQEYMDLNGFIELRKREAEVLAQLDCRNTVISTGGSAVYAETSMRRLKTLGPCVYLSVTLEEIKRRLQNFEERGVAAPPGTSLEALYEERVPLYNRYADITIDVGAELVEESVKKVVAQINKN